MFVKLSAYTVCENSCQILKPLLNHAQLLSAEIPGFVASLFCAAFTDKSQLFCFYKNGRNSDICILPLITRFKGTISLRLLSKKISTFQMSISDKEALWILIKKVG